MTISIALHAPQVVLEKWMHGDLKCKQVIHSFHLQQVIRFISSDHYDSQFQADYNLAFAII